MFICLELDTDQVITWNKVEKALIDELGLTHIVWGVTSDKTKPLPFKISSNLFYTDASIGAGKLSELAQAIVKKNCDYGYNIITIKETTWSHNAVTKVNSASSSIVTETDEIISREE